MKLKINNNLIKNKKILYQNVSGQTGTITLSKNPIEGKTIEVEYSADGITAIAKFVYKPNVKFSLPLLYIGASNNHMVFNSTYTMNDLNVTFNNANNNYITTSNAINSYGFASYIRINKVTMYE